ncbi:hypothetical protein KIH74_10930 [Kineosporia sp. J2-2]|uniref:DUF6879 domain-containing protein n=1 Tax=Kineosporia corallincola TaxID=2835133 RepID=A0ABS5TGZ1_9ACTN|nr:DUF6879 family protein [Kineosporia corallincola]MBT0769436.1 hypothetical protein [Kineosporia corallincola]
MPIDLRGGEIQQLADYYADFEQRMAGCQEFWKLERGQTFAEPADESWLAFEAGDWDTAARLIERRRADLEAYHRELRQAGTRTARVRVVERPLSAYLQWELRLLRIRDEAGGPIRVLDAGAVAGLETGGPLPEIYTMDETVMYEAVYDDSGVLDHAVRYRDADVVRAGRELIGDLYRRAEPIAAFFGREIDPAQPVLPDRPALPADYLRSRGRPAPIRS